MPLIYPAVFYPGESGAYAIEFPDLPGCVSGGDDIAEAIEMAQDAACGWIANEVERGKPIPQPSKRGDVHPDPDEPGAFVNLLTLDMYAFAMKFGKYAVPKSPAPTTTAKNKLNIDSAVISKHLD
jgi:predicted RNase H-like HicB family nuclease